MKKSLVCKICILIASGSMVFGAGLWDSVKESYNKIMSDVKDAGNSVDYFKKCDDKNNIEYFQKENTHLHETLYVSSIRGTNIKNEPSSSAKTLCVAPLNMPVRLLKVEKKDTINNGESYWVKVYIPYYLQQIYKCGETGYIFGNYLSHDLVELKEIPQNWNKDSLKDFMMSGLWNSKNVFYLFKLDGSYDKHENGNSKINNGKWSVTDGSTLVIDEKSYSVIIKDAWNITIDGISYEKKYNSKYLQDMELITEPAFYHVDKNGMNILEYSIAFGNQNINLETVQLLGFSLKKTIIDDELEAYWRSKKGEIRNYHYENVKINESEKKAGKVNYTKADIPIDLDNDKEVETVFYKESDNVLTFYLQKNDFYYELKSKNPISSLNKDNIIVSVATSMESPVPYIIIKRKGDRKVGIEAYTISGTELKLLCKAEESYNELDNDLKISYYFDLDNFYVNFYLCDSNNAFKLLSSYICEQNVNDIYNFSQKKLKLKN